MMRPITVAVVTAAVSKLVNFESASDTHNITKSVTTKAKLYEMKQVCVGGGRVLRSLQPHSDIQYIIVIAPNFIKNVGKICLRGVNFCYGESFFWEVRLLRNCNLLPKLLIFSRRFFHLWAG